MLYIDILCTLLVPLCPPTSPCAYPYSSRMKAEVSTEAQQVCANAVQLSDATLGNKHKIQQIKNMLERLAVDVNAIQPTPGGR